MDRREFLQEGALTAVEITLSNLHPRKRANPDVLEDDIFVAPYGNDRNAGTASRPLASLERARLEVRKRKGHVRKPLTAWVRAGTYYFSRPSFSRRRTLAALTRQSPTPR